MLAILVSLALLIVLTFRKINIVVVGIAAGTCLGIRLKAKEKKIRRGINRAARNVEHAFDNMTR